MKIYKHTKYLLNKDSNQVNSFKKSKRMVILYLAICQQICPTDSQIFKNYRNITKCAIIIKNWKVKSNTRPINNNKWIIRKNNWNKMMKLMTTLSRSLLVAIHKLMQMFNNFKIKRFIKNNNLSPLSISRINQVTLFK